jgi:hypothetical protein
LQRIKKPHLSTKGLKKKAIFVGYPKKIKIDFDEAETNPKENA